MKRSIRWQMITFFVMIITSMIFMIWVINNNFLEKYYLHKKQDELKDVQQIMIDAVQDGRLEDSEFRTKISELSEKGGIGIVLLDQTTQTVYTNEYDSPVLVRRLMGYTFNQLPVQEEDIIEREFDYVIGIIHSQDTQTDYLEMWGSVGAGYIFLMQSPLENIRENVNASNTFLLYVGAGVTMFGAVLVWYLSKRLIKPILALTEVSKKMTELDFEVKYKGNEKNEIGILGQNFNLMSKKLADTIVKLKNANYDLQRDIKRKENIEIARTEFIGNVSHELKTPLSLIQGYAEGLKVNINNNEESRAFYCDVIIDEAEKMNILVRNLLTLNQFEVGKGDTEFERFNIVELINGVIESSKILSQANNVSVRFAEKEDLSVLADHFKTEQVIRNYLDNAINHATTGSTIDVKVRRMRNKAQISVFNLGDTIPQEDMQHIWEQFYKVDKAHTREYGGSGLGLSIVKAIMTSFQQQFGVKNYENGVEFWFELEIQ